MIRTITYKESTCWKRTFNMDGTYGDKPSGLSTPNFSEFSEYSRLNCCKPTEMKMTLTDVTSDAIRA